MYYEEEGENSTSVPSSPTKPIEAEIAIGLLYARYVPCRPRPCTPDSTKQSQLDGIAACNANKASRRGKRGTTI